MNNFKTEILDILLQYFYRESPLFCINEEYTSYRVFGMHVAGIREVLTSSEDLYVGLVANNDIETYASIIALWLEGKAYVPLHPDIPLERCNDIIEQVNLSLILDSGIKSRFQNIKTLCTRNLSADPASLSMYSDIPDERIAYMLFTSGSTGKPKGVQISRKNLSAFVCAFWDLGYHINESDRCLQAFDLTFDLSVMSYLIPMLKGACIYTVPYDRIKYTFIAELLEEQQLTVALMVPSTIRYLSPYFDEINAPYLRYNLFCGEALPLDITEKWSKCVPNACIDNVYGPTEDTIFCSRYKYDRERNNKHHNGILSIGKSVVGNRMIIVDENKEEVSANIHGELCLAGDLLTPGYWKNEEKNVEVFFIGTDGVRNYRTGDLCYKDVDGDIMYIGRLDFQAKIQGFRVELGEIEYYVRQYLNGVNAIAVTQIGLYGTDEIILFVENNSVDFMLLKEYLKNKLPSYMIPARFISEPVFPLNANGKVDRNMLKTLIK